MWLVNLIQSDDHIHSGGQLKHDGSICMRCGACVSVCPFDVLELEYELMVGEGCSECGDCAAVCPVDAIRCYHEI
ncbi:4Fe-4S dicluster protein [Methanothermobacter defluvii]|uniref:4Fe-4S dicluster protein n=1 Tax=Methanothermobacter defluvii TaxID=49339 RepID=A0A371NB29_9EURY|nr:4Fe-4S dicluster protein [Methanothermobacter defluvii]